MLIWHWKATSHTHAPYSPFTSVLRRVVHTFLSIFTAAWVPWKLLMHGKEIHTPGSFWYAFENGHDKSQRRETNEGSLRIRPRNGEAATDQFFRVNFGIIPTYLSKNNACSIPSHNETITSKLNTSVTAGIMRDNYNILQLYALWWNLHTNCSFVPVSTHSVFFSFQSSMGCVFLCKMAADLFCITLFTFLFTLPALIGSQSNRTVFSPSSTSGN